jgi:NAD(P)-dependent dehydrogenase (short-subunit alcohol dehydrogenase family)
VNDRILITGGSGGIGAAVAAACAARGAWPIVGYRDHETQANELVRRCGSGETLRIDLQSDDLGLAAGLPEADAVVHCAGSYAAERSLLEADADELVRLLQVNALGPLRLTRALLAQRTGIRHVVFVLSTAVACRGTGPYALSKATALAVSRLLSVELSPLGVRVDSIVPGWTNTAMARAAAQATVGGLDNVCAAHLDGRILEPEEIGELAAELMFDAPARPGGHLVVWDRRDSRDPVWLGQQCTLPVVGEPTHLSSATS